MPVLLAVATVAIKLLGALTFALASAVVAVILAAFAIDLLSLALLAASLLAALALANCAHIHRLWSSMSV